MFFMCTAFEFLQFRQLNQNGGPVGAAVDANDDADVDADASKNKLVTNLQKQTAAVPIVLL